MEYRRLGGSGLQVSALSFGSWVTFGAQVGEDLAHDCMQAAYDAGVNFFDNAEVYAWGEAERIMGNVLRKAGWKRSELVISTKIFWGARAADGPVDRAVNQRGLSRKHVIEGTEASLHRLGLDYVDLLFAHRPDPATPIEETVRAMNWLIDQGKALYWGTSEWSADQIMEAHGVARRERLVPPTMEQPQYNMFHRHRVEHEYQRLYREIGLGATVWSPLSSGLLTGKYNDGIPEGTRMTVEDFEWLRDRVESDEGRRNVEKVKQLAPIAADLGLTLPRLALAWCLKNDNVSTVITGASKPEQVIENMKAVDDAAQLTPEILEKIESVLDNKPGPLPRFR